MRDESQMAAFNCNGENAGLWSRKYTIDIRSYYATEWSGQIKPPIKIHGVSRQYNLIS